MFIQTNKNIANLQRHYQSYVGVKLFMPTYLRWEPLAVIFLGGLLRR